MNGTTTARNFVGGAVRLPGFPAFMRGIIALALLVLCVLFVLDHLYDPEHFRIREVEVRGRYSQVDGQQVKERVEQSLSGNYFSLSLPAIEARIEQLPWVFSASVRRQWPDTLMVDVAEVQPVAKWGQHQWLNSTGDLVERQAGAAGQNLPLLSGPDNRKQAVWQAFRRWSEMFAGNGLSLVQLRFDPRGLWHLKLSLSALALERTAGAADRQTALAPVTMIVAQEASPEQTDARIRQFLAALHHRLIAEFPAMRSIDLRYPNGFAIGWKTSPPGAP